MGKSRRRILISVVASLFALLLACLLAFSILYLTGPKRGGPLVTIRSPQNGEEVSVGEVVNVHSTSRDDVKKVAKVELWVDGKLIETDTHPQGASLFTVVQGWQPLSSGFHTIIVRAFNGADLPGQATIGVEAVEVPPEAVAEREPLPLPGELPPVEELIEEGVIPPGMDVDAPPGGLPPAEEVPPAEEIPAPPAEEVPVPGEFVMPPAEVVTSPGEILMPPEVLTPAEGVVVPPAVEIFPPERVLVPRPDPGGPPANLGDAVAIGVIDLVGTLFGPPLPVAPTQVKFEALEFAVYEDYDDIYCYVSLANGPVERAPEMGFFRPLGERRWDIAEYLGGENSRVIEVPSSGPLRVFVECYGWLGGTHEHLGLVDTSHLPEEWDGRIIRVHGTGSDGFDLAYRIIVVISGIPAPYDLRHVQIGGWHYLDWTWDGNEEEIDGFRVYRNDNLVATLSAGERSASVSTWWITPPCGERNEFYVKAYKGEFGEGVESYPSNRLTFEGPPCGEIDDILSVELLPSPPCEGIRGVDIYYRYGSEHGEQVYICAWPVGEGSTPFGGCSKVLIGHGEGVARTNLEYPGGERVESQQLWVSMWDLEENAFYSEIVNLPIVWNEDRPDLFISDAEMDCEGLSRRVVIENGGCGRAETDELHLGFVSSDGQYQEGSLPISISLGPGEKYEWRYVEGFPPGEGEEAKEKYRSRWGDGFTVTVDSEKLIDETNEDNNSFEAITAGFAFSEGGRRIGSCMPIFGEPDTDEDGIRDAWENAATIALNPYIELDEDEKLFKHSSHRVVNFVRITPYPSKEDPKYILIYNVFSWSGDYGRVAEYVYYEAHNGDTEPFIMAWQVEDDHTIKLHSALNFAHGGVTKQENIWDPYGYICHETGISNALGNEIGKCRYCSALQFRDSGDGRPRLLLYASQDKHALYPSCEACQSVVLFQAKKIGTAVQVILDILTGGILRLIDGIRELYKDDHLGTQRLLLTYEDMKPAAGLAAVVGHAVKFEGSDYKYILSVDIDNSNFPMVRIFLKKLYCDNETNCDEGCCIKRCSDEPYLIMAGFLVSPTETRAWAPENQPRGNDVDSDEYDSAFENVLLFEGEVTPETTVGFVFSLIEDDFKHNDPNASERREKAEEVAQRVLEELSGTVEARGCARERGAVPQYKIVENCSGSGTWEFPAYNVGEPPPSNDVQPDDRTWIRDLGPYGFPDEYLMGIYCSEEPGYYGTVCGGELPSGTKFCGSQDCQWRCHAWTTREWDLICATPIANWMRTHEEYLAKVRAKIRGSEEAAKWLSEHPKRVEFFEGLR